MNELATQISAEIAANGPMPFSRFMDLALYHPELGFYAATGRAGGRSGDFVTSVETGPLFGAVVADWLDARWRALDQPTPFRVAEAAAGVGTLWRAVVRAEPACAAALRWTLVERSAVLRDTHDRLPPGATSRPDLPEGPVHVVLANELLDNLAVDLVIRNDHGWKPMLVSPLEQQFVLRAAAEASPAAHTLPHDVPVGTILPVPVGALQWLADARAIAEHVLVFDYTATDAELVERGLDGWLRAYAAHRRVEDPLDAPGTCDITHDVPLDRLPRAESVLSQAEWLARNGLEERLEQAATTWRERAHIGDLAAMFARSAITEAGVLTDPSGLGGFTVMEWTGSPTQDR